MDPSRVRDPKSIPGIPSLWIWDKIPTKIWDKSPPSLDSAPFLPQKFQIGAAGSAPNPGVWGSQTIPMIPGNTNPPNQPGMGQEFPQSHPRIPSQREFTGSWPEMGSRGIQGSHTKGMDPKNPIPWEFTGSWMGSWSWDFPAGSRAQSLGFSGPNPWDFPLGSRPKSMGLSVGILTQIPGVFRWDPDPSPWDFPAPIPGIFHWDPSPSLCPALAPALPWTPSPKQRENIGISTGIPHPAPQEEIPTKSLEKTTCPQLQGGGKQEWETPGAMIPLFLGDFP